MFTDERRCNVWDQVRQHDLRVFGKILTPALMKEAAQAAGVKLGNNPLNHANMVWLGIAAAFNTTKNFADILILTFKLLQDADQWNPDQPPSKPKRRSSKHNPHGRTRTAVSEEAFVQARQLMSMDYWMWLLLLLARCFQNKHPDAVRWNGFRLLALDGTEIALPYRKTLADLPKSQTLRAIRYHLRGFRPSAVVTNALDPKIVSREDWVRMATADDAGRVLETGLYHRRWEIETMFCELKVRQGMQRSLRGRTAEGVSFEVAGHVPLYFLTRWLIFEAAEKNGVSPLRISFTQALREINDMRHALLLADPQRVRRVLLPRLLWRIAQHIVPLRPGRHYPRPADRYRKGKYRQSAKQVTMQT